MSDGRGQERASIFKSTIMDVPKRKKLSQIKLNKRKESEGVVVICFKLMNTLLLNLQIDKLDCESNSIYKLIDWKL